MQGKSLVQFFLVLMTGVCLYQLLLTFPTNKLETAAENYGNKAVTKMTDSPEKDIERRKATNLFLDSTSADPLFMGQTYSTLKKKQLALGLDLKGGMSVVLQVDLRDLIINLAGGSADPAFLQALAGAKKAQANSQTDYVTLFGEEFAKIANGRKLGSVFAGNPSLRSEINFDSPDATVLTLIRKRAEETVDLTYDRLKKRIDKFGATQPNVVLDKRTGRIIVELPGVTNPERARNILQASAKLEFWDVYRVNEVMPLLDNANTALKSIAWDKKTDDTAKTQVDTSKKAAGDIYAAAGPLYKYLTKGGQSYAIMGTSNGRDTAKVNRMLQNPGVRGLFPRNLKFLWSQKAMKDDKGKPTRNYMLFAVKTQPSKAEAPLTGDCITTARATTDPLSGSYVVTLDMNPDGSRTWARMTREAAPEKREIVIALDDEVVSYPSVQGEIAGGNTQITGNFSPEEATDLANVLQVGKLPARTEIIEENVVGPTLGKENINSSFWAMAVGILMTILFMVAYYSSAGVVAVIALLANFIFLIACLASFGTVLTVPGIAGFVLTIGMAVDANIVIYERIREELREGKSTAQAIKDGFKHSYPPIIDSHVTALITSLILFWFGLGPIKGFGLVLTFGVICTLFASLFVSRLVMDWWTGRGGELKYSTKLSERIFENVNIDFVGMRKTTYILSGLFSLIAIISMFTRSFDWGVDFTGGYSYAVKFDKAVQADDVREVLTKTFGVEPTVKTFNTNNTLEITTQYLVNDQGPKVDEQVRAKLAEGLQKYGKYEITRSIKIGSTVADDIRNSSIKTSLLAITLIFLYILFRFRKWQYSLGATVALLHDVIHTLGWFTLFWGIFPFSMQIDQAFIAAILTIIGYSMNDTVIVFDRIREYLALYPDEPQDRIINKAINNTLNRTIITSFVTLLTVVILLIFGGPVIKGFAFALTIGMIVGTYSSIFIATPIVVDLSREDLGKKVTVDKEVATA